MRDIKLSCFFYLSVAECKKIVLSDTSMRYIIPVTVIIIIMILFLIRFSMLDMLNCAEQHKCLNTHTMLKNLKQCITH